MSSARRLARDVHAFHVHLVQFDGVIAFIPRLRDRFRYVLRRRIANQAGIGRHVSGRGAAEQAVQRQAGALPGQVPQRNVYPADGKIGDTVTSEQVGVAEHAVLQRGDLRGVGADEHRLEDLAHHRGGGLRHAVSERLAVSRQARIGVYGNNHLVEIPPRPRHFLFAGRHGNGQYVGLHVGNVHGALL